MSTTKEKVITVEGAKYTIRRWTNKERKEVAKKTTKGVLDKLTNVESQDVTLDIVNKNTGLPLEELDGMEGVVTDIIYQEIINFNIAPLVLKQPSNIPSSETIPPS